MKKIIFTAIVALFAVGAVSAQERGKWGVGPQIGIYTNTGADGAIFGVGAQGRYSITDHWRSARRAARWISRAMRSICSV